MTDKTENNPILVGTYGVNAPKAARFGVGATNRSEIEEAADARRARSDANKPRTYSTRRFNVRARGQSGHTASGP